jgi:hypothetical protein
MARLAGVRERVLPGSSLSNEFRLAAACCEWPASSSRDQRLRELASAIDWPLTLQLARRHRIEGLVHRALSDAGVEVPEQERTVLARAAAAIGTQSLLQGAESARLQRLLGEQDIRCTFLKGVPLAMLAYGTLGVKQAWDIDLLVPPKVPRPRSRYSSRRATPANIPRWRTS